MARKAKKPRPLTLKQSRFCEEWLIDGNGTRAYRAAGYSAKSDLVAAVEAHKLLKHPKIAPVIAASRQKRSERTEITQDMVLKELWRIAGLDLSKAYDEAGNLLPLHEMPEDVRRAIAGLETLEEMQGVGENRRKVGDTRKLKIWDKVRALELLGKHLGIFTDRVKIGPLQEDLEAEIAELKSILEKELGVSDHSRDTAPA